MNNLDTNTLDVMPEAEIKQIIELFAPCDGLFIALDQVKNLTYAQKSLGEGFAIEPACDLIYSPVNGTVAEILDTKHALILDQKGNNVLVHMGIDTVSLKGSPFKIHVDQGQEVSSEVPMAEMDIVQVEAAGRLATVIVVLLNDSEQELKIDYLIQENQVPVRAGQKIATVQFS